MNEFNSGIQVRNLKNLVSFGIAGRSSIPDAPVFFPSFTKSPASWLTCMKLLPLRALASKRVLKTLWMKRRKKWNCDRMVTNYSINGPRISDLSYISSSFENLPISFMHESPLSSEVVIVFSLIGVKA